MDRSVTTGDRRAAATACARIAPRTAPGRRSGAGQGGPFADGGSAQGRITPVSGRTRVVAGCSRTAASASPIRTCIVARMTAPGSPDPVPGEGTAQFEQQQIGGDPDLPRHTVGERTLDGDSEVGRAL
ncbi:hypothetical protein SAMN05216360_10942 [Methylobacterium phyllostachyos]|uniref:Uncharacterized protein n=1 Tax=Methylobacterium phyllostachyos TaxID=582672 RepID=A0A1H0C6S0_9HYPH|nr:hypothetical protein SAMN05216360_10942 [Methylobacterium phyllostachyos]